MSTDSTDPARRQPGENGCALACARKLVVLAALACTAAAGAATTAPAQGPGPSAGHGSAASASATSVQPLRSARKQASLVPIERIDINGAKLKQLMTLPGVSAAEARRIIANRPYLSKAELVHKGVLPIGPYLSLKDRIVALQKLPQKPRS